VPALKHRRGQRSSEEKQAVAGSGRSAGHGQEPLAAGTSHRVMLAGAASLVGLCKQLLMPVRFLPALKRNQSFANSLL